MSNDVSHGVGRAAILALALVLFSIGASTAADDPPPPKKEPPKPWQPFKDIPEVLYFESFEGENAGIWDKAAINDKVVQAPETHSLKLGAAGDKENSMVGRANIGGLGPFKLVGGLRISDVKIQYMAWADIQGHVDVTVGDGKTNWKHAFNINKTQTWTAVQLDLAMCDNSYGHPKENTALTELTINFVPQHAKACTAYIDDFIISNAVKPAEILPRVLAIETKRSEVLRIPSRDGVSFNHLGQDMVQSAIKASKLKRRARTVVVIAARPADTEALKTALPAAAAKLKGGSDFKFVFAEAPDGTPAVGLEDMHTLLQYNIARSEAEMALLVLGDSDVNDSAAPGSETIRVVQERALECGCLPIFCAAPGNMTGNTKLRSNLDRLWSAVAASSKATGAPWADIAFACKDQGALEKGELTTLGFQNLAELSLKAIKHADTYVFGRK
jgi:hypothetical protein